MIENKINDKKHHFEQYINTYNIRPQQLGYITNYPLKKEGFTTHTWEEFHDYITSNIPKSESVLWEGYLKYVEKVCSILITNEAMNLKGMFSLWNFYDKLEGVISQSTDIYQSEPYEKAKRYGGNVEGYPNEYGMFGRYFKLIIKDIEINECLGWIGVYFDREYPDIYINFDNLENWGKPVFEILESGIRKEGNNYKAPSKDEYGYWFKFKKKEEFDNGSLEDQKKLLKDFFNEVMTSIYKTAKESPKFNNNQSKIAEPPSV